MGWVNGKKGPRACLVDDLHHIAIDLCNVVNDKRNVIYDKRNVIYDLRKVFKVFMLFLWKHVMFSLETKKHDN